MTANRKFSVIGFRYLVRTGLYEMLREPRLLFFTLLFPLLFLGLFGFMSAFIPNSSSLGVSLFQFEFPGIFVFALMSVGLLGTSVPIIELRKKGTLRLLKVTPLSESTFIISQIVVRLILGVCQILFFLILGLVLGDVHWSGVGPMFLIAFVGLAFMLTLGFFAGGLFKSVEIASGVISGVMPILLMLSGVMIPFYILPKSLKTVAQFSPFSYLGDAMRQVMYSMRDYYPVYVEIILLAACVVLFYFLTRVTFRWVKE